jgi:hypothetical protein
MKLAPVGFLAALGIFLTAMAASQRGSYEGQMTQLPLDFAGVDTLEVQANNYSNIIIDSSNSPSISYTREYDNITGETSKVEVIKQNQKLLIKADLKNYQSFDIRVPNTVRHMVLSGATVSSNGTLDALDINVSADGLNWNGNAKALSIRAVDKERSCLERYCSNRISIDSGVIDQLTILAEKGEVSLGRANELKATRLLLGPEVRLSVSNAGSLKNIQFEEYGAKPAASVTPTE